MAEDEQRRQQAIVAGRAFDAHDADGGGTLDVTELEPLAEYLGLPLVAGSLEETLRAIDKDGSSELERDEFVEWWVERYTGAGLQKQAEQQAIVARRAFAEYDADDSGAIDMAELVTLTEELGLPLTQEEAEEAMELLDTDHNGTLERDEFVSWWAERATGGSGASSGASRSALARKLDKLAAKGRQRHHTDLHTACWKGDAELVGEFIAADDTLVNQADTTTYGGGYSPLMYAAYQGHAAVVEALLGAGARVNAQNDAGCTALFLAAQQGRPEAVAALLRAGADARIPDGEHGLTALEVLTDNAQAVKAAFKASGKFEVPPPPRMPELRAVGPYAVEVSWGAPELSGKAALLPVTRFKVKLSVVGEAGALAPAGLLVAGKTAESVVLDELESGATYVAQVASVSGVGFGAYSEPTEPVTTTGAPREPPRPEVVDATATSFELRWGAPEAADEVLVYVREVSRRPLPDWRVAERVPADADERGVWVTGLEPGRVYEVCLAWRNELGEGDKSAPAEVETPGLEIHVPSSDDEDSDAEQLAEERARALAATMESSSGEETGSESDDAAGW